MTRSPSFRDLSALALAFALVATAGLAQTPLSAETDALTEQAAEAPATTPPGAHRIHVPGAVASATPQPSAATGDAAADGGETPTPPPAEGPEGLGLVNMTAPAGVELTVSLTANAPRDPADRIRIAPPGAGPEDASGGEALVAIDGPVLIDAPVVPGSWELRYVAQGEGGPQVLEASTLIVVDAEYKSPRNRAAAQP